MKTWKAAERPALLSDSALMGLASLGSQAIGAVRGIVVPLILGPMEFGLWRTLLVLYQYGGFLHLGSLAYLNRELPGLEATGRLDAAHDLQANAFRTTVQFSGLGGTLLVFASFLLDDVASYAAAFCGIALILQQLGVFQQVLLRARLDFRRLAAATLSGGLASLAGVVLLGKHWGAAGMMCALALGSITAIAVAWPAASFPKLRFGLRGLRTLVFQGAPLSALPLLLMSGNNVGQLVATGMFGLEAAGHYGMGIMLGSLATAFPQALGMVLYPRLLSSIATGSSSVQAGLLLRHALALTSVGVPFAVGSGLLVVEPLLLHVFPEFGGAMPTVQILLVGTGLAAYMQVTQGAFLALRRHWVVIKILCLSVPLSAACGALAGLTTGTVAGVAVGSCLVTGASTFLLVVLALRWTAHGPLDAVRDVGVLLIPPAAIAGTTALALSTTAAEGSALGATLATAVLRVGMLAASTVGSAYLMWTLLRRDRPLA